MSEVILKKGLTVVMPCLNEEITLETCIRKAQGFMERYGIDGEVIVADNGSTDRSIEIAKSCGARVVNISQKGYGSALRGGIEAADYEYIVMGDADDSYDFSALDDFIKKLDEGYELVMGNRFKGGIKKGAMSFSHQYIGNPFLSGLGRLLFKTDIGDFHCGLRAFRKDSILKLGLCTTGMEFASEMVVKAVLFGLKISEIPIILYPDGRNRPPHLRSIPDGLRHLEFLLIYSPKWLFMIPGMILSVLGLILTVIIGIHPLHVGAVEFDVTTMFYSAMVMFIGVMMLQFSTFTTIFAERIGQFPPNSKSVHKIVDIVNKRGYGISVITMIIGLAGVILTIVRWSNVGFGHLLTTDTCRMAILFGSILVIGTQMLLFTLFIRVLQMGVSTK